MTDEPKLAALAVRSIACQLRGSDELLYAPVGFACARIASNGSVETREWWFMPGRLPDRATILWHWLRHPLFFGRTKEDMLKSRLTLNSAFFEVLRYAAGAPLVVRREKLLRSMLEQGLDANYLPALNSLKFLSLIDVTESLERRINTEGWRFSQSGDELYKLCRLLKMTDSAKMPKNRDSLASEAHLMLELGRRIVASRDYTGELRPPRPRRPPRGQ